MWFAKCNIFAIDMHYLAYRINLKQKYQFMKKLFYVVLVLTAIGIVFNACKKDEENPAYVNVMLGAQDSSTPGFYSVDKNKVYTLDAAFNDQASIDMFCFYEESTGNNIALASPGTGITGIFTGTSSVENWTTTDTTFFCATTLTPDQFNAITTSDSLIVTSFDPTTARKKAKDLQVDDIYSIKIQSGDYGLLMVTAVTQGANGSVDFQLKMMK
jgi:hypothetical protein